MTYDPNTDDPRTRAVYFVGIIGVLLLVVAVYLAHGMYYGVARSDAGGKISGKSALLEASYVQQEQSLDGYRIREDIETKQKLTTMPLGDAKAPVKAQLKSRQGT
ncbi:MAG: hypothetical protein ACKVX7_03255 [Planctomycetota bacterium]